MGGCLQFFNLSNTCTTCRGRGRGNLKNIKKKILKYLKNICRGVSQTCDLNQTVGAMTDQSVVLGGGVGGGVKDGGNGRVFSHWFG